MAVLITKMNSNMNSGHLQSQLTRSLERILEDARLSGELKLSGRKLKDFPKAAGKFDLSDTVIADISRNRFCELPEDITTYPFLETLLVYHNTIRSIPDTVRGLHCLSYLDLRSNQLTVLPREICLLPIQILLVSNNRLLALPEELGRMEHLTELDASCNQITHLPSRMGDLNNLRSLSLRNNQLVYLPREITCLQLVTLDISCNRIAMLPVELRLMTSLVDLLLENNPLTSPPTSLCVRGLIHVFKYLETVALKEEKSKAGVGSYDGNTTLRRTITTKHANALLEGQKNKRNQIDSGYLTSDDKRWSGDVCQGNNDELSSKWSPTPLHVRTDISSPITSAKISPSNLSYEGNTLEEELNRASTEKHNNNNNHFNNNIKIANGLINDNNNYSNYKKSPDVCDTTIGTSILSTTIEKDKKSLENIQTYREYKEALRQQRNQDSIIYRSKDTTPTDSKLSTPSPSSYNCNQNFSISPHHSNKMNGASGNNCINDNDNEQNNIIIDTLSTSSSPILTANKKTIHFDETATTPLKKRLIPTATGTSSNRTSNYTNLNGNHSHNNHTIVANNDNTKTINGKTSNTDYNSYVKPTSPSKISGIMTHNNVPLSPTSPNAQKLNGIQKSTTNYGNNNTAASTTTKKSNRNVSWNQDVANDKLSFTMRREFDKQKEETELIEQLRKIIESRLKMQLPSDIAPALTDGVVLCHLANQVRPRSVASIHVPSPAVPKLTMARCRRNVDNFLDACRKIGIDENLMCCAADVLEGKGAVQVAITVCELLRYHKQQFAQQKLQQQQSGNNGIKSPTRLTTQITTGSPLTSPRNNSTQVTTTKIITSPIHTSSSTLT